MSDPIVKIATTEAEREAIYRFRYVTYVEELNFFRPIADHERRQLRDVRDETAMHIYVDQDGQVAGSLRINFGADAPFTGDFLETYSPSLFEGVLGQDKMSVLTRFMVRKDLRGSFLPFQMLIEAGKQQVARGVELAFCDCQPHLLNLYKGLGMRTYRSTFNDPEMGVMVPLVLVVGDHAYFEKIGSPLLEAIGRHGAPGVAEKLVPLLKGKTPVRVANPEKPAEYFGEVFGMLSAHGADRNIFAGLSEEESQAVLASSHVLTCNAGDVVIREGQFSRTVFVVLEGALEVLDEGKVVAVPGVGEVVGEVSFLLASKRISNVRAAGQGAKVLSLSEKTLRGLIESNSRAAALLLMNFSKALALKLVERSQR